MHQHTEWPNILQNAYLYFKKEKIFTSKKLFMTALFPEAFLKQFGCGSNSSLQGALLGEKTKIKEYFLDHEKSTIYELFNHRNFNKLTNAALLTGLVEWYCSDYQNRSKISISQTEDGFLSSSVEAEGTYTVNMLNYLYQQAKEGNAKEFWYQIVYYCHLGRFNIAVESSEVIKETLKDLLISPSALDDYIANIILPTGTSGLFGVRRVLYLAGQEKYQANPFILFEAGEIHYYDKIGSGESNYEAAFQYYQKADLLNLPLATWSLGYMYQKYNQKDSITGKVIRFPLHSDLENNEIERHKAALGYFQKALKGNCGAAFNSIGNYCTYPMETLIELWDILYPAAWVNEAKHVNNTQKRRIIKKNKHKILGYYYEEAAKRDDLNGMYNYYRWIIKSIEAEKKETVKKSLCLKYREVIRTYLERLVHYEYPAACNDYALHLLNLHSDYNKYLFESDVYKGEMLLQIAANKKGAEFFPWANYNYAKFILMERKEFTEAMVLFDRCIAEGCNDWCAIKCYQDIFSCIKSVYSLEEARKHINRYSNQLYIFIRNHSKENEVINKTLKELANDIGAFTKETWLIHELSKN